MGNNDAPAALLWSTSKLVKTNSMFKNAINFNKPVFVDGSDTTKVTDMASMFEDADTYNLAVAAEFYTDKVTSMNSMFKNAVAFDQDIGVVTADKWNVGNVVDMTSMFEGAIFYNNDNNVLTGKLLNLWDVGKVTSFMNMFT